MKSAQSVAHPIKSIKKSWTEHILCHLQQTAHVLLTRIHYCFRAKGCLSHTAIIANHKHFSRTSLSSRAPAFKLIYSKWVWCHEFFCLSWSNGLHIWKFLMTVWTVSICYVTIDVVTKGWFVLFLCSPKAIFLTKIREMWILSFDNGTLAMWKGKV
jgi:hypothetical protein